jgi:hypothetical protein
MPTGVYPRKPENTIKNGNAWRGKKRPPFSKEWKENLSKSHLGVNTREKSGMWKDDRVGYDALHDWVKRYYGEPSICEHCFTENLTGCKINWANKTGEYKRDREDWLRLCIKCHRLYDKTHKIRMHSRFDIKCSKKK